MTDMLKAANDQPPEFKYYVDLALHSLMLHVCTARLKRKGSLGERIREEVSLGERAPLQAGHAPPPKKHKPSQLVQAAARALWAVAWPVITHKLEEAGLGGWVGVWCSWLAGRRVVCAHCCRPTHTVSRSRPLLAAHHAVATMCMCHYDNVKECKVEDGQKWCNATLKLIEQGLARVRVGGGPRAGARAFR